MNKQIQDIENKIFYEIDRLNDENVYLKQQIEELNGIINGNNKSDVDESISSGRCVKINNNEQQFMDQIVEDLNSTKNDLINTRDNCNSILNLDNKKMENVKSKFDKIKNYVEMNEAQNNSTNLSINEENDIIENKEHLEILRYSWIYLDLLKSKSIKFCILCFRKVYQEATHRLLIFRNLIKEREKLTLNYRANNNNVPELAKHHARIQYLDNNGECEKISETTESTENSLNTIIENNNYDSCKMKKQIKNSNKKYTHLPYVLHI
jgi:hypothetical protein